MKKKLLFITSLFVGGLLNVNAQCTVSLNRNKTKICSNDKVTLNATPSSQKSIPNTSKTETVFDLSTDDNFKNLTSVIQTGLLNGTSYPLSQFKGNFTLPLVGLQLKNTIISSGSIDVSIKTDLKQDLKIVFELPYFIKNGKALKDSFMIDGKAPGIGYQTISKTFDLTNSTIDFSAGDPANYNIVSYKINPIIKISTTTFTAKETCDLTLDLKGINFTENIKFAWYKDGKVIANQANASLDVTETGKYKVETTSTTTNCIAQDTISIQVVQLPVKDVTKTGDLTFCEGNSVTLSAVAKGTGYKYTWSDKSTDNSLIVKKAGSYTVTVTNDICSITSDPISIQVVQLPVKDVTKTGDLTFCEGNSATLSAVAKGTGYKYTWSDKSTGNSLIVKKTGSYTVTVTNDICSITSDPIAVTVNPNPIVKLNQKIDTTIVVGSQLVLRASGAKEYLWSTNSKLDSIVVKDSNNYIVTGKNEFGCTSTASVKIKLREKKAGLAENTINFSISPNPATSFLKIDLAETNATSINASIYDLSGKLVVKTEVSTAKSVLNIESLDKGMYVLVLEDQANTTLNSARFVVE